MTFLTVQTWTFQGLKIDFQYPQAINYIISQEEEAANGFQILSQGAINPLIFVTHEFLLFIYASYRIK